MGAKKMKEESKKVIKKLPLTSPDTADCAFSLIPISAASDPDMTASGPELPAPARNKKIQL